MVILSYEKNWNKAIREDLGEKVGEEIQTEEGAAALEAAITRLVGGDN